MNLMTGAFAMDSATNRIMQLQIGANMDQNTRVFIGTMTAQGLGIRQSDGNIISLETIDDANRTIGTMDAALRIINKQRADLGAYQNRLEHAVRGIDIGAENLQAAESRIRDTDMARQMVSYTRDQILSQAGTAMLAQANQRAATVLQILR